MRPWARQRFLQPLAPATSRTFPTMPCLGLVVVLACFALLEWHHPYWFLQDDNRTFFLPNFLHNLQAATSGNLALYNFFEHRGTVHLALGQSAVLHPLPYLALSASSVLFGHHLAGMELLALLLLLGTFIGTYALGRRLGLDPAPATFAGTAMALCSFVVQGGASWWVFLHLSAYFPALLALDLAHLRSRDTASGLGGVLLRLLGFYCGHFQLFLLGILFEALFVGGWAVLEFGGRRRAPSGALLSWSTGLALSLLGAAPLLLPALAQLGESAFRTAPLDPLQCFQRSVDLPVLWRGLFSRNPGDYGDYARLTFSSLVYDGLLPPLATLALLLAVPFRAARPLRGPTGLLLLLGLPPLFLGLAPVLELLSNTPLLNLFRWHFKSIYFTYLALNLLAGFALQRFGQRLSRPRLVCVIALLMLLQTIDVMSLHLSAPPRSFSIKAEGPPPVEDSLVEVLAGTRLLTLPHLADADLIFLDFNYPTLRRVVHFAGYADPLLGKRQFDGLTSLGASFISAGGEVHFDDGVLPVELLRSWGVSRYLLGSDYLGRYGPVLREHGLTPCIREERRVVFCDGRARPLVSWEDGGTESLDEFTLGPEGLRCRVETPAPRTLILAWLQDPRLALRLDGRLVPTSPDGRGRISADLPPGQHELLLRFEDPLFELALRGSLSGYAAVFLLGLLVRLLGSRRKAAGSGKDLSSGTLP